MSAETVNDVVLMLEVPLRKLGAVLSRDELEAILEEALNDVYEDEEA